MDRDLTRDNREMFPAWESTALTVALSTPTQYIKQLKVLFYLCPPDIFFLFEYGLKVINLLVFKWPKPWV